MNKTPPWWHSPGITFAGRCRLRNGIVQHIVPFGAPGTTAAYKALHVALFYGLDGNALAFGGTSTGQWDIIENLENLTRRDA